MTEIERERKRKRKSKQTPRQSNLLLCTAEQIKKEPDSEIKRLKQKPPCRVSVKAQSLLIV